MLSKIQSCVQFVTHTKYSGFVAQCYDSSRHQDGAVVSSFTRQEIPRPQLTYHTEPTPCKFVVLTQRDI